MVGSQFGSDRAVAKAEKYRQMARLLHERARQPEFARDREAMMAMAGSFMEQARQADAERRTGIRAKMPFFARLVGA